MTLRFSVGRKYAVLTLHPQTPSPMAKHRLAALGASTSTAGGGGAGSKQTDGSPTSTSPRSSSPRASDLMEEWGGEAGLGPLALIEAAERAMNEEDVPVYLEEEVRAGLHHLHLADIAEPPGHVGAALMALSPAGGSPSPAPARWAALFTSRSLTWKVHRSTCTSTSSTCLSFLLRYACWFRVLLREFQVHLRRTNAFKPTSFVLVAFF